MADRPLPHVDVAGLLLGDLEPDEHAHARDHVAGCAACRAELDDLRDVADQFLLAGAATRPPYALADRVLAAVGDEAAGDRAAGDRAADDRAADDEAADDRADRVASHDATSVATPGPVPVTPRATRDAARRPDHRTRRGARGWGLRLAGGLAAAAVAVLAFVVGVEVADRAPGEVELQTQLAAPDGDLETQVTVRRLETGRAVDVTSTELPILPDGGLYELWFVGPGDTPQSPNRISAGTFHPDQDGNTSVELHAAVVPSEYPTVVITAEANDGDPAPDGPEVVRSTPDG